MLKTSEIIKLFIAFLILMVLGHFYNKYKKNIDSEERFNDHEMIQKYLLNESTLLRNNKPILWIHVEFDKNARNWESFQSRSTTDLNQPYQYLTIRSIIDKCGKSFNVCLIDDEAFGKIIPNWKTEVHNLPRPLSTHIRELALAKVLAQYGGFIVPSSFICLKNMFDVYDATLKQNHVMVGELYARSGVSSQTQYFPNPQFLACRKNDPVIKEYIQHLEANVSRDNTNESDFNAESGRWFYKEFMEKSVTDAGKHKVAIIPAELLGAKTTDNKAVIVDTLIHDHDVHFSPDILGIYIPANEILKRNNFQWFSRLSPNQVMESNTLIGKYLLGTLAPE